MRATIFNLTPCIWQVGLTRRSLLGGVRHLEDFDILRHWSEKRADIIIIVIIILIINVIINVIIIVINNVIINVIIMLISSLLEVSSPLHLRTTGKRGWLSLIARNRWTII